MSKPATLAAGADLTAETWADFVARLNYDCVGEGVNEHYTSNAVFLVERCEEVAVPEGCGDRVVIFDGCDTSQSPSDFFSGCCETNQENLNAACDGDFLAADDYEKSSALENHLPDYRLIHVVDRWKTVNQHFTKAAAEAFIKRKKHDYPHGLRVYVDSSYYSWELNAIKTAILSGRIGLLPGTEGAQP